MKNDMKKILFDMQIACIILWLANMIFHSSIFLESANIISAIFIILSIIFLPIHIILMRMYSYKDVEDDDIVIIG